MSVSASTERRPFQASPRGVRSNDVTPWWLLLMAATGLLFLILPVFWLLRSSSIQGAYEAMSTRVTQDALLLSLLTTSVSTVVVIVFGGALAYVLARHKFFGAVLIDTIIDVPMVLPPMVTGLALMVFFGRNGPAGAWLADHDIQVSFSQNAVMIAQVYVSLPFFVRSARAAFEGVDQRLVAASLLLGASKWRSFVAVTLPTVWPPILAGAILAWARSLGEFGATLIFAGNFQGETQTMPLAIFGALQDDINIAITLSILLLAVSFVLVALLKVVTSKYGARDA